MDFTINEEDTIVIKSNSGMTLYLGIDYANLEGSITLTTSDGVTYQTYFAFESESET